VRRKRETRLRLLEAAFELMAAKGVEGIAIHEITEAADVGFGSFYNHFESKEALHAAVVDWVFEDFGRAIDRLVAGIPDIAEGISVSVRHTLLRARRERIWGLFLVRQGISVRDLRQGLGLRLFRDIKKGIKARRFSVHDPLMALMVTGGIILGSIVLESQSATRRPLLLEGLGLVGPDLPERTAAMLLQTLGLGRSEAMSIAQRPLPKAVDGGAPGSTPGGCVP
jgi:AcrR family transcriptional regulator